jgi:DNA invertase Pin-like site-specific DNA recombinase
MATKSLRLDLVIRTSQRKKDAQSPAQQRQQAQGILAPTKHKIVIEHDSARSESGKTMERAALAAVRARIRAGETDGIVVGYLDRLGRAPIEESMAFVRELTRDGGVLIAADWGSDPIDLSDPNVEDMLVFRLQMNRSQWTKSAQRYLLSQRNAIEAGKFVGPTPLGYLRRNGRLYEHPELGKVIRKAYRIAASDGLHAAVDFLLEKVPSRDWTVDSTRKLLASRVYLGEAWIWVEVPGSDSKARKVNDKAHKALTTLALWTAAQTTPKHRRRNGDYILSGVARCSGCGGPMVGHLQTVHGRIYRRLRCSNKWNGGKVTCDAAASISADGLEDFYRELMAAALNRKEIRVALVPGGLEEALEELEMAESDLSRWAADDRTRDLIGETSFYAGLEARSSAVERAREAYQDVASQSASASALPSGDELDDPAQFARALNAMIDPERGIRIRAGRGSVEERILDYGWKGSVVAALPAAA